MQSATKVFLREELYERVWTTPMYRLAKEFGYSDVGLAKLCEKHNIPRPEMGYWQRTNWWLVSTLVKTIPIPEFSSE